jgi:adenylylsulfate reductase subunit B
MSILIDPELCVGCGECCRICPGSLLRLVEDGARAPYAQIRYPQECWNCASCVKLCPERAISLYLPPESGGCGARMRARQEGSLLHWEVIFPSGRRRVISVDRKSVNRY